MGDAVGTNVGAGVVVFVADSVFAAVTVGAAVRDATASMTAVGVGV